jgi:hypothetical protein
MSFSPAQLLRYRRYARDKRARRDIIDNNCTCGHHGTVSDFDIAKYHAVCAKPNIVADDDRTGYMALAANQPGWLRVIVIATVDNHIRSYKNVIAYLDVRTCRNYGAAIHEYSVSEVDALREFKQDTLRNVQARTA